MASIGEDYTIIGILLENNGTYPGDPQCYSLNSYLNQWGGRTFHVSYSRSDDDALWMSPFCRDIILLWTKEGITEAGKVVLREYNRRKSQ